jgi:hypothetical protein
MGLWRFTGCFWEKVSAYGDFTGCFWEKVSGRNPILFSMQQRYCPLLLANRLCCYNSEVNQIPTGLASSNKAILI